MKRVPPSTRIREEIDSFLKNGITGETSLASELIKLGAQLIAQESLEKEVTDYLGRGHYERGDRESAGWRNGYEPARIKSAEGMVPLSVPQLRGTADPYRSRLLGFLRGNTDVLERLVSEMYARGLSTRDVEDALTDATGECLISKSSVSELTDSLNQEYEAFQSRDLSDLDVLYLFADGVYEALRREERGKEAILVAWAILSNGQRVLLSMSLGNKESYEAWLGFFRDLKKRGLKDPITITQDGSPGGIRAADEVFSNSLRVRCWVHKMQNILAKLPESGKDEVRPYLYAIRDAATFEIGEEAAADAIAKFKDKYPSAMKCLCDDLTASLNHLKVPFGHRKSVRTTNMVERSFVEERRRTKTIPGFFGEKAALKLVFAVLQRASRRWQRIRITELELRQIELLRIELQEANQANPPTKVERMKEVVAS
jgi:transposase-like protein